MTTALEEANEVMRRAVRERLDNTPKDDPKMKGYEPAESCCDGGQCHPRSPSAAEIVKRFGLPRGADEWQQLHDELHRLHVEKTRQYGHEESAFANIEASSLCGVEPWRRCLCDLSDCVVRMQRYANGQPVDWENALLDAAMWSMLCLLMLRREQRGA